MKGWNRSMKTVVSNIMGKKFLLIALCISMTMLCMACGDKKESSDNLEGSLTDIMASIYENAQLDAGFREALDSFETVELTDDLEISILGTDEVTYTEGVVSMPMMSSIAFQCVLLRVDEADVETVKQTLKNNANPDKWVCVSAETTLIESRGNVIFFIMSSKNEAYALNEAFQKL